MTQISDPTGNTSFTDGDYMLSPMGYCKLTYLNSNFVLTWVIPPAPSGSSNPIWATSNTPNSGVTAVFFNGRLSIGSVWTDGNTGNHSNSTLEVDDDGYVRIRSAGGVVLWQNGVVSSFRLLELLKSTPMDIQGVIDTLEANHVAEIAWDQDRRRRRSQPPKQNGQLRHVETAYSGPAAE
jgi:hypothetical protein